LVGGGLIRSIGGWQAFKTLSKAGVHLKSDERILGDGDFVEEVLKKAQEQRERQCQLEAYGFTINQVAERVAAILGVKYEQVWEKGKYPQTVKARSLLCYWAVRELGISATELARRIGISQPAISQSVKRGETIAKENEFELMNL
jgi:chromosomal replication initiation ATPase DnaA